MTERIGYNPYFYNYPQYSSNNLGVNNKFSPNFRGDSVGVTSPQTSVNYTTPPDTVEISAGNKINEASTQEKQKNGMSTGAKIGLGILGTAATVYGCIVGHRMINKPSIEKVAKNFSEIFRREIGTDEAQKMVNNYKELLEIKDKDEFCKKAFEQVKKDYGYENISIKFQNFTTKKNIKGACNTLHHRIEANYNNNKQFLETLIHEFQHLKQQEYAYRTDKKMHIEAFYKRLLKTNTNYIDELLKLNNLPKNTININNIETETKDTIKNSLNDLFGSKQNFDKNSEYYKQGLKYIDNEANYINNGKEYFEQLIEKEAFATGDKLKEIYNYFANPWRIF